MSGGNSPKGMADAIVCQNAINYWLRAADPVTLTAILKLGGRFVANSMDSPLPTQPM